MHTGFFSSTTSLYDGTYTKIQYQKLNKTCMYAPFDMKSQQIRTISYLLLYYYCQLIFFSIKTKFLIKCLSINRLLTGVLKSATSQYGGIYSTVNKVCILSYKSQHIYKRIWQYSGWKQHIYNANYYLTVILDRPTGGGV